MADNLGLQQAVANFLNVRQAKKKQTLDEYMARLSQELAERKFAEDVRHRKTMEEYSQGMLAERQKPEPTKTEQFESGGKFYTRDPITGEVQPVLYGEEHLAPTKKPEKEASVSFTTPEGIEISGNYSQIKPYLDQYGSAPKPADRSKEFDLHQDVTKMAAGMAGKENWEMAGMMSPEQKKQWEGNIYDQMKAGISVSDIKPPQIREVSPRQEGGWFGSDTPATADTTFFEPGQMQGQETDPVFNTYEDVVDFVNSNPQYRYILDNPKVKTLSRRGQ